MQYRHHAAGFLLALALAGAAGVTSILALRGVLTSTDARRERTLLFERAQDMRLAIAQKIAAGRAYLMTGERKDTREISAARTRALAILVALEDDTDSAIEHRLLAEIRALEEHHQRELMAIASSGSGPALFATRLRPISNRLDAALLALARHETERRDVVTDTATRTATLASWAVAFASLGAIFLGALVAVVQSRRLTGSIIREREAAERAAASEQEAQMFRMLEAIPVGVFVLRDGKPYYANQHATEILGAGLVPDAATAELPELYKVHVAGTADLYPADRLPVVRAMAGESCTATDLEIWHGEERIPLQVSAVPVAGSDGAVEYAIAAFQDIRELRRIALCDTLTGLANRAAFAESFGRVQALCDRAQQPLSVALIDLDHFKSVNDKHGHAVGDEVLRRTASIVASSLRTSDVVCRWGGEELAVLLPEADPARAVRVLDRVLARVAAERFTGAEGASFSVTFSAGVAAVGRDAPLEAAVAEADTALYSAKNEGRARVLAAS